MSIVIQSDDGTEYVATPKEEALTMQKALHIRTTVLPGGKVEIVNQDLPVGEDVDVVVSPALSYGAGDLPWTS